MTSVPETDRTETDDVRSCTLVWIDAREATLVELEGDHARIDHLESEVPAHHKATGHVRHDPNVRHGGGRPQTAGEPHRLEHLKRFVGEIADRLAPDDDLLILGPGTVHERLARQLLESDARSGRHRRIACEPSPPATDPQLVARLRAYVGLELRRHTVGAYRWSEPRTDGRSRREPPPRRVVNKPRRLRGPAAMDR